MTDTTKPGPCPFCGGEDIFIEPDERGSGGQHVAPYHVGCKACKAEQMAETEDEAIAAWNRRPSPSVHRQASAEPTDLCPGCQGSGEQQFMTQHLGPNDYEVTGPCSKCGGTGATKSRQASAGQEGVKEAIRAAGGIVHSDGNIFFTSEKRFLAAALSTAAPESGWIDVKERMPAVNERVIFYRAEGLCIGWRITETEWADDSFQDRDGYPTECWGVTHWQPLPAAPTAGETL